MKNFFYLFAMVALLATSACTKDDEVYDDVTLKVGETYTIPNGKNTTWTASNPVVVSIVGEVITAEVVGTTQVSSTKGSFTVTVVANDASFKEPILQWGLSKNGVIDAMKKNYAGYALAEESDNELTYYGTGIVTMYNYEVDPTLSGSTMFVDADLVSPDAIIYFVSKRYVITEVEEDGSVYFASTNGATAGVLFSENIAGGVYWVVYYIPVDSTRAADVKVALQNKVKKANVNKAYFNKLKVALDK